MEWETAALVGVAGILIVLLSIQGIWTPLAHGFAYGVGPRDEPRPRSVFARRLDRTVANHIEGLAAFLPLLLAAHLLDAYGVLTALGAMIFFAGRLLFAAFYVGGVPILRSLAFGVSATGLGMIGWAVVATLIEVS